MVEKPMQDQVHLTDPRALRAYAHPTRMTLVGLLRREGPCTATQAARSIGESVASCSYHLRILAKYGLVEEADPGGPGRDKPWRATAEYTNWPNHSDDPAVAQAAEALTAAVLENHFHRVTRALEVRHELPREWQEAEVFSDHVLYLTPEELTELGEAVDALVARYRDRGTHPERRPERARRVAFLRVGHVLPDPGGVPGEEER
ncbi:helix-turn-helix domain-containing protein [Streptomyces sp. HPF1205]|uniref:winged helix-turn-helix domain-containing protein n=1 Tax=Streptomyces sp. HPF1205 TaxID=2873262 RepID=UPI001CEDC7C2|nr:helix-turn-helix domain-containing protein [Streptomyces sp. HPF1205]